MDSTLYIKAKFQNEFRRFSLENQANFMTFKLSIFSFFNLPQPEVVFTYLDDEKEKIVFSSQVEWLEALELYKRKKFEKLGVEITLGIPKKTKPRLSLPFSSMKTTYDVIVIGSGYGGAISASRLSRAGQKVCLLERGKEMWPGEYPEDLIQAAFEVQIDRPNGRNGKPTGFYDFRFNDEMHVWIGCGLGGTSLVNANVAVFPDKKVFDYFPPEIKERYDLIENGFKLTDQWLQTKPVPEKYDLPKSYALKRSGLTTGGKWFQPPLAVSWEKQTSTGGIEMNACINCANCVTGCNNQSKNTTLMNYIPDAKKHGTEIFCQVEVKYIEKKDDIWIIHGINHEFNRNFSVRCKTCIIAGDPLEALNCYSGQKKRA